jgi:hypothetical protein
MTVGKVYNIPPQPPVADDTHYLPAGAVTFGVEYRALDPESLRATYAENAAHLAELEEKSPAGGFSDEGVSIHVCGTDDHHEYLRFDVFDRDPHYHYIHRTAPGEGVVNNVVDYDQAALGDMLPWTIERLRTRLPQMLGAAGGTAIARQLDMAVTGPVIDEVASIAARARVQRSSAHPS